MTLQEYARAVELRQRGREDKLLERFLPKPATARVVLKKLNDGLREYLGPAVQRLIREAQEAFVDTILFGTAVTKVKAGGHWYGIRWRRGTKHLRYPKPREEDRFRGLAMRYKVPPFLRLRWKGEPETYGLSPVMATLDDIRGRYSREWKEIEKLRDRPSLELVE